METSLHPPSVPNLLQSGLPLIAPTLLKICFIIFGIKTISGTLFYFTVLLDYISYKSLDVSHWPPLK